MNRSVHFNRGNARDAVAGMGAGYKSPATLQLCNMARLGAESLGRQGVEGGEPGDRILTGSAAGGSPGKLCGPTLPAAASSTEISA